eukprot:g74229.t1
MSWLDICPNLQEFHAFCRGIGAAMLNGRLLDRSGCSVVAANVTRPATDADPSGPLQVHVQLPRRTLSDPSVVPQASGSAVVSSAASDNAVVSSPGRSCPLPCHPEASCHAMLEALRRELAATRWEMAMAQATNTNLEYDLAELQDRLEQARTELVDLELKYQNDISQLELKTGQRKPIKLKKSSSFASFVRHLERSKLKKSSPFKRVVELFASRSKKKRSKSRSSKSNASTPRSGVYFDDSDEEGKATKQRLEPETSLERARTEYAVQLVEQAMASPTPEGAEGKRTSQEATPPSVADVAENNMVTTVSAAKNDMLTLTSSETGPSLQPTTRRNASESAKNGNTSVKRFAVSSVAELKTQTERLGREKSKWQTPREKAQQLQVLARENTWPRAAKNGSTTSGATLLQTLKALDAQSAKISSQAELTRANLAAQSPSYSPSQATRSPALDGSFRRLRGKEKTPGILLSLPKINTETPKHFPRGRVILPNPAGKESPLLTCKRYNSAGSASPFIAYQRNASAGSVATPPSHHGVLAVECSIQASTPSDSQCRGCYDWPGDTPRDVFNVGKGMVGRPRSSSDSFSSTPAQRSVSQPSRQLPRTPQSPRTPQLPRTPCHGGHAEGALSLDTFMHSRRLEAPSRQRTHAAEAIESSPGASHRVLKEVLEEKNPDRELDSPYYKDCDFVTPCETPLERGSRMSRRSSIQQLESVPRSSTIPQQTSAISHQHRASAHKSPKKSRFNFSQRHADGTMWHLSPRVVDSARIPE